MQSDRVLDILREVFAKLAAERGGLALMPEVLNAETTLDALQVTEANVGDFARELRHRLGGVALNVEMMFRLQKAFQGTDTGAGAGAILGPYRTLGDVVKHIQASLHHGIPNPLVVYVDDEEENLFVFRRKYGKRLNLKTFSDPHEALAFIRSSGDTVLVLTDEVMPGMTGNQLCDEVHKSRPFLKFILITGNPAGDDNLMHRSLRHGRFYDFINKPLDFEGKGEEYFSAMNRVLSGDFF